MTREERSELINHLKYNRTIGADYLITDKDVDEIIKALEERKVGKWEIIACDLYMCSKCYSKFTHNFKFCPNCGAKMESEVEE